MRPAAVLRAGGVLACLQRAEKGEWHGGPRPPYGYRLLPAGGKRTLAVVPEAAALLHEAAGRVLAGQSLYAIRQDWNRRGLTSGAGKPWRSQGIKRCLVRAAVAGLTERLGEVFPGPQARHADLRPAQRPAPP